MTGVDIKISSKMAVTIITVSSLSITFTRGTPKLVEFHDINLAG